MGKGEGPVLKGTNPVTHLLSALPSPSDSTGWSSCLLSMPLNRQSNCKIQQRGGLTGVDKGGAEERGWGEVSSVHSIYVYGNVPV